MATKYRPTEMRPIWYRRGQWSPRTTIVFTVINAVVTGFFHGVTLLQYLRGRSSLNWLTPLAIAFSSAVITLRGTLDALHGSPPRKKTVGGEATVHNVS